MFFNSLNLYAFSKETKLEIIEIVLSGTWGYSWLDILMSCRHTLVLAVYIIATWRLSNQVKMAQTEPNNQKNAAWFKTFCEGFLVLIVLDIGIRMVFFSMKFKAPTFELILASLIAVAIHLAAYHLFDGLKDFPKILPVFSKENNSPKYKTSPLGPQQMKSCQDNLLNLMDTQKPYLNASLKIADLAQQLDIPSHYLSQVLSESMDTNFYTFINTYRINAAKALLTDEKYQHYSILSISMECGFGNKTTFNRTFKKLTGMTPSQFVNTYSNTP